MWQDYQARQVYCSQCKSGDLCECSPDRRELMALLCASPSSEAKTCLSGNSNAEAAGQKGDLKLHACLENEAKKDPAVQALIGRVDELMRQRYREQCLKQELTDAERAEQKMEALIDRVRQMRVNDYEQARSKKDSGAASRVLLSAPAMAEQLLKEDESQVRPWLRVERLRFAGVGYLCAAVLEPDATVRGNYARKASDCFLRALNEVDALPTLAELQSWTMTPVGNKQ